MSVESAKWVGSFSLYNPPTLILHFTHQGTYLGTLEDVNHLDLVGWVNTARYKWAELIGHEIKFKPATFYLGVADHLARVVEGAGKSVSRSASQNRIDKWNGDKSVEEGSQKGWQKEDRLNPASGEKSARKDSELGADGTQAGAGVKTSEGIEKRVPTSEHKGNDTSESR